MILQRISTRGAGQMPPLASTVVVTQAVALLQVWITNSLAGYQSFAGWQTENFGATNLGSAQPAADPDEDRSPNSLEYLTGTNPQLGSEVWRFGVERTGDTILVKFPRVLNRGFEVQWNDNLTNGGLWRFLDVPENRPFFSSTNGEACVRDVLATEAAKFYRVLVYEP